MRHQWQLYGFICTLLVSPADVDEVLQETSIILWSKFGDFRQDQSFLNWACGVAHLEVLRFYRKNRRRLLPLEEPGMEQLLAAQRERSTRPDSRRMHETTATAGSRVDLALLRARRVVQRSR